MASAKRTESMRSIQSAWSIKREQIIDLLGGKRSNMIEVLKLAALTFLPLAVVIGLCIKTLINENHEINNAIAIRASVERSQKIGGLVSALLKERGLTCQYLAIEDGNISQVLQNLVKAKNNTNDIMRKIKDDLPASFSNFTMALEELRLKSLAKESNVTCSNVSDWYMFYTKQLEAECSRPFTAGGINTFWSAYFAYNALLEAQDMIGLQRALGSSYFGSGNMSLHDYVYFAKNVGGAEAIFQQITSVLYAPAANTYASYDGMTRNEVNIDTIFNHALEKSSIKKGAASDFFASMTIYINRISQIGDLMRNQMMADADEEKRNRLIEFHITLCLAVLVLIISPAFTVWYAYRSRKLLRKISKFTDKLKEQKSQLNVERKKAELLLCQMLPKSIVMDMAKNKPVEPECFDEATIFFSKVDDFASFVMKNEPFQVVNFLNHLYNQCDNILDQYDAYKVETIGDSYVIVSGVPRRNGKQHSAEIATIALHFLMMMETFEMPAIPIEKIKLVLGINTGPVVAGVMGLKQQRYCLFGDTVNTASRMMSHGIASYIHSSPSTIEHLHTNHVGEFKTQLRGPVEMKGKGTVITHWLIGRKSFPFIVNMTSNCNDIPAQVIRSSDL